MTLKTDVTVIIPALNEAGNIRRLVTEVRATAPGHPAVSAALSGDA